MAGGTGWGAAGGAGVGAVAAGAALGAVPLASKPERSSGSGPRATGMASLPRAEPPCFTA